MAQVVTDTINSRLRPEGRVGRKGYARKLRARGGVPAVVYGPGSDIQYLQLDHKDFLQQLEAYGEAHVYQVDVEDGQSFRALVKDVQWDWVEDTMLHVDFYAVDTSKPVRIQVEVELTGRARGVKAGGALTQTQHQLEVSGLPDRIPDKLEVDISELDAGATLHISDIPLPEDVTFTSQADEAVATISAPAGAGAGEGE